LWYAASHVQLTLLYHNYAAVLLNFNAATTLTIDINIGFANEKERLSSFGKRA